MSTLTKKWMPKIPLSGSQPIHQGASHPNDGRLVEAASRSLPEYTEESIGTLVDKIIDAQVAEGFFKECPITFKDIALVKALFKEKLKTMYHTRISYPELKK